MFVSARIVVAFSVSVDATRALAVTIFKFIAVTSAFFAIKFVLARVAASSVAFYSITLPPEYKMAAIAFSLNISVRASSSPFKTTNAASRSFNASPAAVLAARASLAFVTAVSSANFADSIAVLATVTASLRGFKAASAAITASFSHLASGGLQAAFAFSRASAVLTTSASAFYLANIVASLAVRTSLIALSIV